MTAASFDVLVVGSTPLARLLAGLLANAHGKRVALVGDSHAAFRLPRALDLSVAPITRPQTWALLAKTVPETRKLLARLGAKTCVRRIDPILLAATPASRDALAHLRSSAAAFGIALEPLAANSSQGEGLLIRDALLLLAAPLEKILDSWLDRSGTVRIPTDSVKIIIAADGGALVEGPETRIDAAHTVLADDAAVLMRSAVPALIRCSASTILTEPTAPVAAPIMLQLDGGLNLVQHGDGGIAAMGPGDVQHLAQQLGTLLEDRHLRRAGQSRYDTARSPDGAPVVGRANGNGPTIVAGLGATGAFLATALARWLACAATPDEARYFLAHSPDRSMLTSGVADYSGQWETVA